MTSKAATAIRIRPLGLRKNRAKAAFRGIRTLTSFKEVKEVFEGFVRDFDT